MFKIKAHIQVYADNKTVFNKNVIRNYDHFEPTITSNVLNAIYKQITNEFYKKYDKIYSQVSVTAKIFYIYGKSNSDS